MKNNNIRENKKYWHGKHIKHLDSVRQLGTRGKSLVSIKAIVKKSLDVNSQVIVKDFKDILKFLSKCKYITDKELFNKQDYWQTPDEFEKNKKGDCEDFSLWAWKKLIDLGEDARFIYGTFGMSGHAWILLFRDDEPYVFEVVSRPWWRFKKKLIPATSKHAYWPVLSIDKHLNFFRY